MNTPTLEEKGQIAKNHLFPRVLSRFGMEVDVPDTIVKQMVQRHSDEPGMRAIEKDVTTVVSSLALGKMYGDPSILGASIGDVSLSTSFVEKVLVAADCDSNRPPPLMYL